MGLHPNDESLERRPSPPRQLATSILTVLGVVFVGFLALATLYQMAGR